MMALQVEEKKRSEVVKSGYVCELVESPKGLAEVSVVRATAYAAKGKISKKYASLTDHFDSKSLILGVRKDGRIVGSARIIVYSANDISETEEFVKLPQEFEDKSTWVEVSRLCVDPAFQDSGVFKILIQNIFKACLKLGKTTILAGASGRLVDIYESLGAERLNVKYNHAALNNLEHEIVKFDLVEIASGKKKLHRKFNSWRQEVLSAMMERQKQLEALNESV